MKLYGLIPIFLLFIFLVPHEAQGQGLKRLKVSYAAISEEQAVISVTKEARIFEKNGLDVELIFVKSPQNIAAMVTREVHISQAAGPPVVYGALAGADAVIIAGIANTPGVSLMASKSVRGPEDLRGKKVGVGRFGDSSDFITRIALRRLGLEPERDVAIIQVGGTPERLAAMKVGAIQAGVLSTGRKLIALRQGFHELLDLADADYPYQHSAVATSGFFIQTQQETLRSFMRAYVEGIHVYKTRRDFTLSVLRKFMRMEDPGLLSEIYNIASRRLPRVPYPTVEGVSNILSDLSARLPKARTARPEDFLEPRFIKELDESGFIERLYR